MAARAQFALLILLLFNSSKAIPTINCSSDLLLVSGQDEPINHIGQIQATSDFFIDTFTVNHNDRLLVKDLAYNTILCITNTGKILDTFIVTRDLNYVFFESRYHQVFNEELVDSSTREYVFTTYGTYGDDGNHEPVNAFTSILPDSLRVDTLYYDRIDYLFDNQLVAIVEDLIIHDNNHEIRLQLQFWGE
ncbi:hypothetical protein PmNV_030 [Penaeus monodon nudivirus]|uniref:Uncharacterized protein n=1 Tax=Penaeus monodon nudivirus TaxID=1529056 RepID=A0A076FCY3_9VIRU|nr:hypothetical protein PmNV_030 [Penaeus monodon nudivirus]AII15818.1 hypothetical protein PmNV_030 [Penaeus monodon nudivirus]